MLIGVIVSLFLAFTYTGEFQKVLKWGLVRLFKANRAYFVSGVYDSNHTLLWMSKNAKPLPEISACFHIQQLCFASNYFTEESAKLHVLLTCEQTGQMSHLFVSKENWAVYFQLSKVLKNRGLKNVCFGSWSAIPNINEVGDFLKHEPCCYLYERNTQPPLKPIIPDSWSLIVNLLFAALNQFFNANIYYYVYGSLIVIVFLYSLYRSWHSTYRRQFYYSVLYVIQRSLSDYLFGKLKFIHTCDPMTNKLWKPAGLRRKFVVSSYTRHEYSSNENRFYAPRVIASIADYDGGVIEHFEGEVHKDGFKVSVLVKNTGPDQNLVSIDSTLYYRRKTVILLSNRSAYCVKKLLEWCGGRMPDAIHTYHWWMNNVHAKDLTDLVSDSASSDFTGYGICIARSRALISPWVSQQLTIPVRNKNKEEFGLITQIPLEFTSWSFWRAGIAEFFATLLFVYITIQTVMGFKHGKVSTAKNDVGIQGMACTFGGMIFALVYCTASISSVVGSSSHWIYRLLVHVATISITGTRINPTKILGA